MSAEPTAPASELADRIDAVLPQTQCRRCGYPACRPYAVAIAHGEAAINRCPPGGSEGVRQLAALTGQAELPLDPACGASMPAQVAVIDEDACIGCTKCIQACPVDAIVGANQFMHSVLADDCTGCELCVAPCPVDCISMLPIADAHLAATRHDLVHADAARRRFVARNERLARDTAARRAPRNARAATPMATATITPQEVLAAIARGRARRKTRAGGP